MNSAEQQKRFKRTAVLQEIYMGQWEVSNEAVNIAMTELRNQDDAGSGDIMKSLEEDVARLQVIMVDEQRRQVHKLGRIASLRTFTCSGSCASHPECLYSCRAAHRWKT